MGKYLTVGQVSKMLSCSPYYVTSLIESGSLESHRFQGKGWHRIPRDSVKAFMSAHGLQEESDASDDKAKMS